MLDNDLLKPLLARVALKDRAAFRQLHDSASAHLLGVALRISGNRALAEEALQDALVQVWQKAQTFRAERAQPSAWLNSIVRYRALDLLRKTGRELPLDDVAEAALPVAVLAGEHSEPALAGCLDELEAEARSCITLAFVDGYSHQELSKRHDRPLGTIKSWIRRGLQQLRECLER